MSEVVVFHSALGRRSAVVAFADELRGDGHTVHTPDLYDGAVYETLDEGIAHRDRIGIAVLLDRARAAVDALPAGVVFLGYSLGGVFAQSLAQNRPGARGAVLLHCVLPPAALGGTWPAEVPLQVHGMESDPWMDIPEARAVVAELGATVPAELFLYSGSGHLFTDSDGADYDPASATRAHTRIRQFLAER